MIRFSKRDWFIAVQSIFSRECYDVYHRVFLCFYKKVAEIPAHFFDGCKGFDDANALLDKTFIHKGEKHEKDSHSHRYHGHYRKRQGVDGARMPYQPHRKRAQLRLSQSDKHAAL